MEKLQYQFRLQPQKNDVLFIDNFKLSTEPTQVLYPYRMAKITKVDNKKQTMSIVLSSLGYRSISRANRDFVVRRHLFSSYFYGEEVELSVKTLLDEEKVIKIKRPFNLLDVENLHNDVEFEKKFEEFPYL
ncbi:hypothetical protein [Pseudoalteromonas sp. Of7M-16]|uniref:hypothetical protein n=1 Tax=Pseudoalteromonas sp. Of7M-16 TaxID=2917756 RepID=UPI001EF5E06D|nr:hypothetical protein [Pseudoalteromonas sp. Of7M-16]MCG7548594.1 hypothetical protein [Pseudoalteromonas sp. Of7M-16]